MFYIPAIKEESNVLNISSHINKSVFSIYVNTTGECVFNVYYVTYIIIVDDDRETYFIEIKSEIENMLPVIFDLCGNKTSRLFVFYINLNVKFVIYKLINIHQRLLGSRQEHPEENWNNCIAAISFQEQL